MPDGSSIAMLYVGFTSADWSAALAQTTRASIWVTALCLVFGALLAVFLSAGFTRPIWKLVDATHAIRRRDFSRRIELHRHDELGQLSESINEMAADLEKSTVSKSFMDGVFRSMVESLLVIHPDGTIASANRATAHLLGYGENELAGIHVEKLFVHDPAEILLTQGAPGESRRFDALVDLERLMIRKDGGQIAVCLSRSVMRSADGQVEGIVLVAQEITRRRAIELASRVEEVERARVAAEAANRAKSAFLANMSHEIRTPMTAILGYADMLLDPGQAASERIKCIETIRRNGRHILSVINDILDISKIEAGKMLVERVPCAPSQIVLDVASLLRARAGEKGLSLDVDFIGPIPASIRTDPTRLRQVLMNLVGNAVKFTERGSVRLVVRMGGEGELRPRLRFEIVDSGVGMSQEQIENLFQPFTQGDTSTTRRFGGTGLGLAITSRLIKMLDGIIQVSSAPGEGTSFVVEIATGSLEGVQMVTDAAGAAAIQPSPVTETPVSPGLGGVRILLAEDGADNRHLITFLLRKAGAMVDSVENGLLAVERALDAKRNASPYDVILMDMQMPELDGYGAVARLRTAGYDGPIIALTAHAMNGDREKCLEAGCDDYTPKPVDKDQLLALIALHAGNRRSANAMPSAA
jgi:PAS domain S-box-containing protein